LATINRIKTKRTHEGAKASHVSPVESLRRTLMACMLWENSFYEDGSSIANRIKSNVKLISNKEILGKIAVEARTEMKLRHAPLLLCNEMSRYGLLTKDVLSAVIQRADDITEFLAIYFKDGKRPIAKQVKLGLSLAFNKFDEYQFAKYNRDGAIKLRDALFLVHAKPHTKEKGDLFDKIATNDLAVPNTWETRLSAGEDKAKVFTELIRENKIGGLAMLRNLRNMVDSGVLRNTIKLGLEQMNASRVLPFRFISAAKHAPKLESLIEQKLFESVKGRHLPGKTVLLVDVSYSMVGTPVSTRSDIDRLDAACGLAIICREMCEEVVVYTFSEDTVLIPDRRGFALRDAIKQQDNSSTDTKKGINVCNREGYDRLIVFTDEQSHTYVPAPKGKGYIINVATYENGVGYGQYTHINGFSEKVLDYIAELEK
jgi:hypothetical protein